MVRWQPSHISDLVLSAKNDLSDLLRTHFERFYHCYNSKIYCFSNNNQVDEMNKFTSIPSPNNAQTAKKNQDLNLRKDVSAIVLN